MRADFMMSAIKKKAQTHTHTTRIDNGCVFTHLPYCDDARNLKIAQLEIVRALLVESSCLHRNPSAEASSEIDKGEKARASPTYRMQKMDV